MFSFSGLQATYFFTFFFLSDSKAPELRTFLALFYSWFGYFLCVPRLGPIFYFGDMASFFPVDFDNLPVSRHLLLKFELRRPGCIVICNEFCTFELNCF